MTDRPATEAVSPPANPFQQARSPVAAPSEQPSTLIPIALSLAVNLVTLLGVLAFGWPPGNAYVLFWIENVVIGLWNIPRILSARGTDTGATIRTQGIGDSPVALALFFCVHYGIFCVVHGVFTGVVAFTVGFRPTFLLLGLPVVLIVIRYTVEAITTWYGPHGLRWTMSPTRTMFSVYPRIAVLHISILLAFFVTVGGGLPAGAEPIREILDPLIALLPPQARQPGVAVVIILVVIKTVVDIATTRRAVTGAGRTPQPSGLGLSS